MAAACIGADLFLSHSELTLTHIGWLVAVVVPLTRAITYAFTRRTRQVNCSSRIVAIYLVSAMGHGVDMAFVSIIERSIDGIADNGVVFSGRDEDVLDVDGDTPAVGRPAVWL